MLLLLFYIADEPFGIRSDDVEEVFSLNHLSNNSVATEISPKYLSGFFSIRELNLPVIDMSMVLKGIASPRCLYTRIAVLANPFKDKFALLLDACVEIEEFDDSKDNPISIIDLNEIERRVLSNG